MNMKISLLRCVLLSLLFGGIGISTLGCDLGTYGRRFDQSKANMRVLKQTPPAQTSTAANKEESANPLSSDERNKRRNLPAAAVGGGGG